MGRVFDQLQPVEDVQQQLDNPIPLGPEGLVHGTLDNGLT